MEYKKIFMFSLSVRWYLSVGWLDMLGKLKVIPNILLGELKDSLDVINAIFSALAHAQVRSVPMIIMTPALFCPFVLGCFVMP